MSEQKKFTRLLMDWNANQNKRQMPWKGEKDPYKVWLSEIILQQTRVEQGLAYYKKFVEKYPSIAKLAAAPDAEVFKLWEGLGYYSRCRNLLVTARFITTNYNGIFPSDYESIKALKGVGSYTASAIASFCFSLPHAVLDGNVFRVLSRVFGIRTATDTTEGKKVFTKLANQVLDKDAPGIYNQAIMDFGATLCKPLLPDCSHCPLNKICVAFKEEAVNIYPVKEKVLAKKERWFTYFILNAEEKTFINKRTGKDIWQNLHEFYLLESAVDLHWNKETAEIFIQQQVGKEEIISLHIHKATKQQLTHQTIKGYFITVHFKKIPKKLKAEKNKWLSKEQISKLAFPVFINQYAKTAKDQLTLF